MDETTVEALFFYQRKATHNLDFKLKPEQIQSATAVIQGKNALILLPTGYGKTMCFVISNKINVTYTCAFMGVAGKVTFFLHSPLLSIVKSLGAKYGLSRQVFSARFWHNVHVQSAQRKSVDLDHIMSYTTLGLPA